MSNLKDYIIAKSNIHNTSNSLIAKNVKSEMVLVQPTLSQSLTSSDGAKFTNELSNVMQSDGFITELSEVVGDPHEFETEDEFVSRASDALRNILLKKLSK